MNPHLHAAPQPGRPALSHLILQWASRSSLLVGLGLTGWLTTATPAPAAVTEAWIHRYSNVVSNSSDAAVQVVQDQAGNIVVTGNTINEITGSDILTIKYSGTDGTAVWQRRYNGPANDDDQVLAIAVDASGNVVVTGSSKSGTNEEGYTAKYAATDGAVLWEKRYTGSANGIHRGRAVAVDGNGDVVVTAVSANANDTTGYYTAKYAGSDGALLWEQRYHAAFGSAGPNSLALDAAGNAVVTGSSDNRDSAIYGGSDYYTAKYAAADGALLWERRVDGFRIYKAAAAVLIDASGNALVTGNGGTFKYAATDGRLLWSTSGGQSLAVDANGNAVVTGSGGTAKYAAGDGRLLWSQAGRQQVAVDGNGDVVVTGFVGFPYRDYYTAKYAAADGALLWERRYDGPANDQDFATALTVDASGNVVVTGSSVGSEGGEDYYTAKYGTADGALRWEARYNGPSGPGKYNDLAQALAADRSGNVIVTGSSDNGANTDYYTAKYSMSDGALVWDRRYNGPAQGNDGAKAVAVDAGGNAVVTGSSVGQGTGRDFYTAMYAAADGALVWDRRYNGPANDDDDARAVAVDAKGNVAVTGSSKNAGVEDCYTAKYASAEGTILWEKRYNASAQGDHRGLAIAVDASGDVIVTGFSNGAYHTAKYGAENGTLLWEKQGPAGSASAVALDASGDVIVTGTAYLAIGGDDAGTAVRASSYTAKYAAADGALLWEHLYSNPGNGEGKALAVAVDAVGNVIVTGYSSVDPFTFDFYTAKYAAADGALLWESNGPVGAALAVVVDDSGNAAVAGTTYRDDGTADYYTAEYAAIDGALRWEKRYDEGFATSLALGPNGAVVVSGFSFGDYATVLYRENLPPALQCPANLVATFSGDGGTLIPFTVTATDESGVSPVVTCQPPSGSVFPIGQSIVTCTATDTDGLSSTCAFTVTVLGARDLIEQALAELMALRGSVSDQPDGKKLDEIIKHLNQSLTANRWIDPNHLAPKQGEQAFREGREAVKQLCDLIRNKKSQLSDTVLQGFVNRLFEADRLLASIAIEEAIKAGASMKKIEQARASLAEGDAEAGDQRCGDGIEAYAKAWKEVTRARISPPAALANGHMQLELQGEPGERFIIQASTNLSDWATIATATANAEGVVMFEDANAARYNVRYYRATAPSKLGAPGSP